MLLRSGIAVAVAIIKPLAWELPYAIGAAVGEKKKRQLVVTLFVCIYIYRYFLAALVACASWARVRNCTTAVTRAKAVTMLDP